jgi:hypothetical protein
VFSSCPSENGVQKSQLESFKYLKLSSALWLGADFTVGLGSDLKVLNI